MPVPFVGTTSLYHFAGRVAKKFSSAAVVLMYHRIAESSSDPWGLAVTPTHFAEQMAVLRKHSRPLSLPQLAQAHSTGRIPARAAVVTFDDGYADNLYNAKPLLEQYDVPATVFLTTGHIGATREFWWDELDRLLLQPGNLPETLSLRVNGRDFRWELGEAAAYSQDEHCLDRSRKAWEGEPGSRLALYYSLWQLLLPIPEEERHKLLEQLLRWAGAEALPRPSHRPMRAEEIEILAQSDLIGLGAHTVTHPFLSAHSVATQRDEIRQSRFELEELLGRPVTSFSYPHGERTADTVLAVQEAGFNCACTTDADTVWRWSDRLQFPRFEVGDWDGETFEKQLLQWFKS
jgi:peptidoglycan/xylan/chitin deacetylase (PgdA/CDA1 family)